MQESSNKKLTDVNEVESFDTVFVNDKKSVKQVSKEKFMELVENSEFYKKFKKDVGDAVNNADYATKRANDISADLEEKRDSGYFNGYTPQRGVDYFNNEDLELAEKYIADKVEPLQEQIDNCIAGLKGFYYKAVDKTGKIIYLTKEQCSSPILKSYDDEDNITYDEYDSMSAEEQKAHFESFGSAAEFFRWYNWVRAIHNNENPSWTTDGNGNWVPILVPIPPIVEVEEDLTYSESAVGKLLSVCNDDSYERCLRVTKVGAGKVYYEIVDANPFEKVVKLPVAFANWEETASILENLSATGYGDTGRALRSTSKDYKVTQKVNVEAGATYELSGHINLTAHATTGAMKAYLLGRGYTADDTKISHVFDNLVFQSKPSNVTLTDVDTNQEVETMESGKWYSFSCTFSTADSDSDTDGGNTDEEVLSGYYFTADIENWAFGGTWLGSAATSWENGALKRSANAAGATLWSPILSNVDASEADQILLRVKVDGATEGSTVIVQVNVVDGETSVWKPYSVQLTEDILAEDGYYEVNLDLTEVNSGTISKIGITQWYDETTGAAETQTFYMDSCEIWSTADVKTLELELRASSGTALYDNISLIKVGDVNATNLVLNGDFEEPGISTKDFAVWCDYCYDEGAIQLRENGTSIVVKSFTEGSNKRFRITIDDSGTLTATEIV